MEPESIPKPIKAKLKPIDYAVMIGGPVAFLACSAALIMMLLGPAPRPNPVQQLRDGKVKTGQTFREMESRVGPASSVTENENGTSTFRYRYSGYDHEARQPIEEDAYVEVGQDGRILSISFDRRVPTVPGSSE
jgi:hypothetical protein